MIITCAFPILQLNMEEPYGSDWPVEEKVKRREMVSPEARYVFVYEPPNENTDHIPELVDRGSTSRVFDKGPIVGFVHYRFTIEEEIPVLYVYELQLHPRVQGKGLGAFLMELTGLIACKVINFSSHFLFLLSVYIHRLAEFGNIVGYVWKVCLQSLRRNLMSFSNYVDGFL